MDHVEVALLQKELDEYLRGVFDSHGGVCGVLHLIHKGNHLVWKGQYRDGTYFALRMTDPTHYRAGEWISAGQEYLLLKDLGHIRLAPQPYGIHYEFKHPFVMMEWVEGKALNALKEAREDHLDAVARAVALLCRQKGMTPERFPFILCISGWRASGNITRYLRLLDACRRMPRRDVAMWAARIFPVVAQVHYILLKYRGNFQDAPWCFHHDGLHAGNVFIREDQSIVFLDWDKVSYRKNPVFTLARFASSLYPYGRIPAEVYLRLVGVFSEEAFKGYDPQRMRHMAVCLLLERICADLVYVLWDFARNPENCGKAIPDALHTALEMRLLGVRDMLVDA